MASKLFGFSIDDENDKLSPSAVSPVPPNNEDGVDHYMSSGFFGSYVDIEGVFRTEFDLIKRYREMALHPEADSAIEDIVNEAIVSDSNDSPVEIELSNLNASDGIKKKIRKEFKYILDLLDFDKKSHEIYRNWYIDGRIYYHKIIDFKNPHEGIQELRYIDAMKMRHVRKQRKAEKDDRNVLLQKGNIQENPMDYQFPEIDEYFIYNPKTSGASGNPMQTSASHGIKIARDAITYCTSGLVDRNKGNVLSYLHKSIKAVNQLRMIEDSLVIYRLSRAPERRIFLMTKNICLCLRTSGYLVERVDVELKFLLCLEVKTSERSRILSTLRKNFTGPLMFRRREWTEKVDLIWVDHLRSLGMN